MSNTALTLPVFAADVLPPRAEPVHPGHTALCEASAGEGELRLGTWAKVLQVDLIESERT